MGAANFWVKNASRYYVVCKTEYLTDEDGDVIRDKDGYQIVDNCYDYHFDIESMGDYIREKAMAAGYSTDKWDAPDRHRNFAEHGLAYLSISKEVNDLTISAELGTLVRAGYYEAAVLDYQGGVYIDGGDEVDEDSFIEVFTDKFEWLNDKRMDAIALMRMRAAKAWAYTELQKMIDFVEQCFAELSGEDQYVCAGRFSNGEAVYQKVTA